MKIDVYTFFYFIPAVYGCCVVTLQSGARGEKNDQNLEGDNPPKTIKNRARCEGKLMPQKITALTKTREVENCGEEQIEHNRGGEKYDPGTDNVPMGGRRNES